MSRSARHVSSSSTSSSSELSFSDDNDASTDAGKSFGELALMSDTATRNASVIADEPTDLLVINRQLFNGTLKAHQEREYQQRKHFIRNSALFRNWTSKFKRLCEMSLRKQTLPFDSVMVKQGEPVVGLHFIIRGQGKVVVDPSMHNVQYKKLMATKKNKASKDTIKHSAPKQQEVRDTCLQEQIRVRRREGYAAAEKRLNTKAVTLCYVDESEIIGDTELVLDLPTYSQTVICTANTEVFILDNKNIERLVHKKNPVTLDLLKQIADDKLRSRARMRVGSQIPLYQRLVDKLDETKPRPYQPYMSRDDEDKKTITDMAQDRDVMMTQLSRMFIDDKVPFIEPAIQGALYYINKSSERAQRRKEAAMSAPPSGSGKSRTRLGIRTGEVRLQRARRLARRQPRSRRELEKLTLGSELRDKKSLEDNSRAVTRYMTGSVVARARPMSAAPDLTLHSDMDISDPQADQVHLGYQHIAPGSNMQQIVLEMGERQQATNSSRARVICSMIEKKTNSRPKSAPAPGGKDAGYAQQDPEEEVDSFDWETSNSALNDLEHRIRSFHSKYDATKKAPPFVSEMNRFNIQGPEDVPIPGGTVYVRQKVCHYPGGLTQHHQHVRRYMVPRDAYKVAVRSLSAMEGERPLTASPSSARKHPRPHTTANPRNTSAV